MRSFDEARTLAHDYGCTLSTRHGHYIVALKGSHMRPHDTTDLEDALSAAAGMALHREMAAKPRHPRGLRY